MYVLRDLDGLHPVQRTAVKTESVIGKVGRTVDERRCTWEHGLRLT